MRLVFGLILILGLGLAGSAVYMVRGYLSTYEAKQSRLQAIADTLVKTVEVYVVTRKIKYSERLTKEDVRLVKWPVDSLPEGAFTSPPTKAEDGTVGEELFPEGARGLRAVRRTMELNEPIMAVKVSNPGENVGIISLLSPGMQAFTINVNATSGVSGFLRPGDKVDIYWIGDHPSNNQKIVKRIQTGIRLLAIDQSTDDDLVDVTVARTVTVEAPSRKLAALLLSQKTGSLSLSLQGTGGIQETDTIIMGQGEALGIEIEAIAEIVPDAVAEKCYKTVRRGTERVKIEDECPP